MNELVCIGKVINFFGIKGELKVLTNFDKKELVYKVGMPIKIKEEDLTITSIRVHKNYYLIRVNDINDINKITKYIGYNIYVKKEDIILEEDDYLLEELIGATVTEGNKNIGKVTEIYTSNYNNYVKVLYNKKSFLIPIIKEYIIKFDRDKKILYTNNALSLII